MKKIQSYNNGLIRRKGFLEAAVIGRMTNITEVLVQIKSNKREGKKHLPGAGVVFAQ